MLNPLLIPLNKPKVCSLVSYVLWRGLNVPLLIIINHTSIVADAMFQFVTMYTLCTLVIQMKDNYMKVTRVCASSVLLLTANKCNHIKYNVIHNVDTAFEYSVLNNPCSAFGVSADANSRTCRSDENFI